MATEVRDDCPSNDFESGEAAGQCWGDGHFACRECKHYRADFKLHGQDYIDFNHASQGGLSANGINLLTI